MTWRRLLIIAATAVVLSLSVSILLMAFKTQSISNEFSGESTFQSNIFSGYNDFRDVDIAESCYPFIWQKTQQEKLRAFLKIPNQPPTGTDELSNALYLQYAENYPSEKVFQEGIRREPNNALYHYLLADMYIKQSLRGEWPKTDKESVTFHYEYTITDRKKLDLGMREFAIGLKMPYQTHRNALIRGQLAAIPSPQGYEDRIIGMSLLASMNFPEFAKMRNFARVNGFYLSLLLSEGKRKEAEPYLHTGEHLVVQVSNEEPVTLIEQLVAMAIGNICKKMDVRVCRTFGLDREAAIIETNQKLLIGKLRDWKDHGRKIDGYNMDSLVYNHAGLIPATLLPIFGSQPKGLITMESLRPSRLIEYVIVERFVAMYLSIIAFVLLMFAGLKYWRWKFVTRGIELLVPDTNLSREEWLHIIGYGLLAPMVLYLIYIAIPAISWRDYGIQRSVLPFCLGAGIFVLWTLFVPIFMAGNIIRKRCIALEIITPDKVSRFAAAVLTVIWCLLALIFILLPVSLALLSILLAKSPLRDTTIQIVEVCIVGIIILGMPLMPAIWTRKDNALANYHLTMSRMMITIYTVMILFFGLLVPVFTAFEHQYMREDKIMAPLIQGDDIGITTVEGKVVIMLRDYVREGATKLGIPWK